MKKIKIFKSGLGLPFTMLFIVSLGSSIMPPIIGPLFLEPNGILPTEGQYLRLNAYGFTVGIYFLGMMIGGFLWGSISDKYGVKKSLIYCLMGSFIATLMCIYALIQISFILFILGRAIDGIMSGRRAVILSLLAQSSTSKTKVFRFTEAVNALGLLVGPILSGYLVNYPDNAPLYYYASPLLIVLILTLVNIVLLFKMKELKSKEIQQDNFQIKKLFKQPIIIQFFIIQLTWYLYYLAILPFAIIEMKFSNFEIGVFFSSMVLIYIIFLIFFKKISKERVGIDSLKITIFLLIIALLSIGPSKYTLYTFILANIGVIFSFSALIPFYMAEISALSNFENQGKLMGAQSSICGIASACIALVLGTILNYSLNLPFYIAAFLVISCLIMRKITLNKAGE